jgi:hypothetical protein
MKYKYLLSFPYHVHTYIHPFIMVYLSIHHGLPLMFRYEPVVPFREGWQDTIDWFRANWLPGYLSRAHQGLVGIADQSQRKIDIQAKGVKKN